MKRKSFSNFIFLSALCILFLNFQSSNVILDVEYQSPEFLYKKKGSIEFSSIESVQTDSFELSERATIGLSTWAKNSDWISFEFETNPSIEIEVVIVDETEWNTKPKDGIFTNIAYSQEGEFGSGLFVPSYESKWVIAFRNPTYMSTEVRYTIEISPHIIILNPSSSTTIYSNSTLQITWDTNFGTWVNIDLYKGSSFKAAVLHNTYNDGSASFYIPEDFSEGSNYKVKISDLNSNEFDFSEQFSIRHPKIEVIYPFQGDTYIPHTTRSIIWTSSGVNSKVSIELCLNSTKILQISSETLNDGEFRWTIWQGDEYALDTYSNYQIQIKDINSQKYIGLGPFFTITKERYLNILTPTHNSSFKTGNYLDISWETDSTAYRVNIRIMQENITKENITEVANNGLYQWKIPDDFKNGANYYISIGAPDNSVNATSELFTVEYIPRAKISGYNIPLISIIVGSMLGLFGFRYKKRSSNFKQDQ